MKSKNGNLFVYSFYWRTWSRILAPRNTVHHKGHCVGTVEVDLTAGSPLTKYQWARVERANIRAHGTARDARDIITDELPADVLSLIQLWLEPQLVEVLLHDDLLPQIDWDLYYKFNNGGASFFDIQRGQ